MTRDSSATHGGLVRWTRALTTGRAVSPASYRRMTTSGRVRRGYLPDYGHGLSLVPLDGRRRIGHNGDITDRARVAAKARREEIIELMRHTDSVAEIQNTLRRSTPVVSAGLEAEEVTCDG